jgi:serine/threonine protein kinase
VTIARLSSPAPDAPPSAWVGYTLDGRYKLLELIGEGGMGAVFSAEQVALRKQVAVKMIHGEFSGNEEIEARFKREALATAQIEHPNVASAIDFGELPGGGRYLVTQLVRGPSLTSLIENKKLPWQRVCDLGAQIADALTAAHSRGIIHRDLKPDNILLEQREEGTVVKVLDFGIARVNDAGAPGSTMALTRLGTVMGTPGYMPPEQAMGEPTDHRADLYALGVILWESLSGRILWDGGELSDLLTRQLTQPPPPLIGEVPDMPPELDQLLAQLLARDAKHRPATAKEVRDVLRALSRGAAVAPAPVSLPPRTIPPPETATTKGLYTLGALFLAAAAIIIVIWALGGGPGEAPPPETPSSFVPAKKS